MNEKLVIVTDLGLFKAYQLEPTPLGTPHLELLEQFLLEEAHHRLVEQVTDFAGRRTDTTQRTGGTPLMDAHNFQLELHRRLIRKIADHIQRLARERTQQPLCLVAPREIHHQLLHALPGNVRDRIRLNVARDLIKAEKTELLASLGAEARPIPREEAAFLSSTA